MSNDLPIITNEYTLVNDDVYLGGTSNVPPVVQSQIHDTVISLFGDSFTTIDNYMANLANALASLEVAENEYRKYIIDRQTDYDSMVATYESWNATFASNSATIQKLDTAYSNLNMAIASHVDSYRAEFQGYVTAKIDSAKVAYADKLQALATSIDSLTSVWESQDGLISGYANASQKISTFVGYDPNDPTKTLAKSLFEYDSVLQLGEYYYETGFGLRSSITHSGDGTLDNPYSSEFWVKADTFTLVDPITNVKPFVVQDGKVYLQNVSIGLAPDVPTHTQGVGEPTSTEPNGSTYYDTTADVTYLRQSDTWVRTKGDTGVGMRNSIVFKRAAATPIPSTPTGGDYNNVVPTGWSDGIPAETNGLPCWFSSRVFTSDGRSPQTSSWTTPILLANTNTIQFQYSVDGSTSWQDAPFNGAFYARSRNNVNGLWSDWTVYKIRGEDAKTIVLTTSSNVVKLTTGGVYSPSSITMVAIPTSTTITTWLYSINGGTPSSTQPSYVTRIGNTVTIATANINATTLAITASDGTISDTVTVTSLIDGLDSISVILGNETHSIPSDVQGLNPRYTGSGTTIKVYQGATELTYDGVGTSNGTWKVVGVGSSITCGSINDSGTYATVNDHSSLTADTAKVSYTITGKHLNGTSFTFVKVQSIGKVKDGKTPIKGIDYTDGVNGTAGARGTAIGYGSSASDSTFTSSTGLSPAKDGDQMVVSSSSSGSSIWTRRSGSWSNSTALYVNGDAVINGTLAANKLIAGSATLGNGYFFALGGSGEANRGAAVVGFAEGSKVGVVGQSKTGTGVHGTGYDGLYGFSSKSGTNGQVGAGNGYSFHAAKDAGQAVFVDGIKPFTGVHDALIHKDSIIEVGDIVSDVCPLVKLDISNVLTEVELSSYMDKSCVGVYSSEPDVPYPAPFALYYEESTESVLNPMYKEFMQEYRAININSLGEGQVNVCGLGGNLEVGDLIVCSAIPGKGMKQADDVVRNYTVAKCRENVEFDYPEQVKQVACIYMCG